MAIKLYKCNICGNIIVKVMDYDTTPSCCGRLMSELRPAMTDGSFEKHVPVYKVEGATVHITVGEEEHPMTDMHHIEFVILETNSGFYVRYLWKDDGMVHPPKACFNIRSDEECIAVYEYCNLHGLYVKECE